MIIPESNRLLLTILHHGIVMLSMVFYVIRDTNWWGLPYQFVCVSFIFYKLKYYSQTIVILHAVKNEIITRTTCLVLPIVIVRSFLCYYQLKYNKSVAAQLIKTLTNSWSFIYVKVGKYIVKSTFSEGSGCTIEDCVRALLML